MPIYEYRCTACGARSEELQPVGSDPPGACAECGGELRRVYGRVAVTFSGWGFSRTDALVSGDRPRKDFKALKERADQISSG
jgi:putative FmdB family regulatory protein